MLSNLVVDQILAAALGVNLDGVCLVVVLTVRCFLVASLGAFLAFCLAVFLINFGAIFLVFVGWANVFFSGESRYLFSWFDTCLRVLDR
ncbi:Chlorophyll a/b light-harvesting protein PcbB [Lactiplantibacillus plantarum]|nr:Chlorophyll a/b light-harvesting protein PcbB [Lactiplantibacillus plantarum]